MAEGNADKGVKLAFQPEIGIHLCRAKRDEAYRGYRKDILTEKLTEREMTVLICKICRGIMKEACLSSSGEQYCSCCIKRDSYSQQNPNVSVREMINSLKCSCPLSERGCRWLGTLENCEDHLETCGYVYETCKCGVVLGRGELKVHAEEKCHQRVVNCDHCKKEFVSREMNGHLDKCPMMSVSCDLKCGAVMCREYMAVHLNHDCGMIQEACQLGCGVQLTRNELQVHENEKCLQRSMKCKYCTNNFKSCELDEHLDKCPMMSVSCDLKCGTVMFREYMRVHLKYDCGKVEETCILGCGDKIPRDELKVHVKDTCVQREILCEHCYKCVKFCDTSKHVKECPLVKVLCDSCSVEKCRKDMTEHMNDYCLEKMTDCPFFKYKCLARMKRKYTDKHLEEEETIHLGLKLTAMEELITEQSKELNTQKYEITKQSEEIDTQKKEVTKQNEEIKKQSELLYSITDTIQIVWIIEDVNNPVKAYKSFESEIYQLAGYTFRFQFRQNILRIVFLETASKYDRPFIAKPTIVLLSKQIRCDRVEVKQKDLTRGCDRIITVISKENVERYSKPISPGGMGNDLTLEINLTIQYRI